MKYFYKTLMSTKFEDNDTLNELKSALLDRQTDLEMQEPMEDGFFFDKWEEKYDELETLIEDLEQLIDEEDLDKKKKLFEDFKTGVIVYQFDYGGLKRLKIY